MSAWCSALPDLKGQHQKAGWEKVPVKGLERIKAWSQCMLLYLSQHKRCLVAHMIFVSNVSSHGPNYIKRAVVASLMQSPKVNQVKVRLMRLDITLKNDQKKCVWREAWTVSNIILSGLLQVPVSFPGNTVWTELIYFSSKCAFFFSGDSWGVCMFLGRDEGVFWAQDKNKMTHLSAFF